MWVVSASLIFVYFVIKQTMTRNDKVAIETRDDVLALVATSEIRNNEQVCDVPEICYVYVGCTQYIVFKAVCIAQFGKDVWEKIKEQQVSELLAAVLGAIPI
jgi:hypothetical protein